MTFILKMKKVLFMMSLSIFLVSATAIPAFASSHLFNHFETNVNKTGDIIDGPNGKEVVVSSLEDGRFITILFDDVTTLDVCSHTNIIGTGVKHQVKSSYNKTDSTYCYKYRYYEDGICGQCGKTGFKIYDRTWTNVKHKYKLFGDTCTVCGYVK